MIGRRRFDNRLRELQISLDCSQSWRQESLRKRNGPADGDRRAVARLVQSSKSAFRREGEFAVFC